MKTQRWELGVPHLMSQSVFLSSMVDLLIGLHDLPYHLLEAVLVVHHWFDELKQGVEKHRVVVWP
jgi:hypothetical protein